MPLNSIANIATLNNSDIDRMNRDDLRHALKLTVPVVRESGNPQGTHQVMQMLTRLHEDNTENFRKLSDRLDVLADTIKKDIRLEFEPIIKKLQDEQQQLRSVVSKQQIFIEQLDRANRENNLIITGVPENIVLCDGPRTADNDEDKCKLLFALIDSQPQVQDMCRLGRPEPNTSRPLKVTLRKNSDRTDIISKSSGLAAKAAPFNHIRFKKDTHPSVRREWARLHECMRKEKDKPTNAGCEIKLDYENRQLLRDGTVIDTFVNPFI